TGLGLAIVAAVAESHGGQVWLAESASGGASFIVELPAAPPDEAEGSGDQPRGGRERRPRSTLSAAT
ncbi:MAG: HAMP domain-containing histidine kinase, partial [Solirubrobacterales bacterium]|nr:HAMP domain-containing histidine kinase [Solirubrobacterales bacterium]